MDTKRLATLILLLVTCSCSPKIYEVIKTETKIEYRDSLIYRDTTIYVTLPVESSVSYVPLNDTSHVETSLAESDAWVDTTGLHHNIKNKDRDIGVTVPVITHVIVDQAHTSKDTITPVYTERKLTWWQQFRIKAFWWLVLIALVGFRREIISLIKFFMKL